jgi:hypothetical protein
MRALPRAADVPRFDRRLFRGPESYSAIGSGALGGKAAGLLLAHEVLDGRPEWLRYPALEVGIPRLTVLATDLFDAFVERNRLLDAVAGGTDDRPLATAFVRAELPEECVGDLWELAREARSPLAIRSSSLLEDALEHPFAGVYATKMIPNDQHRAEERFHKLAEAVKLVYASTYFAGSRAYRKAIGGESREEKMAVIVQEVVGRRHAQRFYPDLSGVARSYNFYPAGSARPHEGVVDLALGLGKTIVDGERCWPYSPAWPRARPPVASARELLDVTQTSFWAVRMGRPPVWDPTTEIEYLWRCSLEDAEHDGVLCRLASTWDAQGDRLRPGTASPGPRVVDFAPLLQFADVPLNEAVRGLLRLFSERLGTGVEIEFAATLGGGEPSRLGFLQVRPMAAASEIVSLPENALEDAAVVVASERAMGNGESEPFRDVVYVRPEGFAARHTPAAAAEISTVNRRLVEARRPYLLVGFGRWGSCDPWLGIPVEWAQISGARAIVETEGEGLRAEMSQGAHFFHNLLSLQVPYLSVPSSGRARIDWDWLRGLPVAWDGERVRHATSPEPLRVLVDGRSGRGVVRRDPGVGA